ncbi:uncharacterized protein [Phyllobates terribilis]|uniref:uncharacterized protein n=1 Tax=Phyllobates terribilis TaxID=111132 RepID=UPI003CCAC6FE
MWPRGSRMQGLQYCLLGLVHLITALTNVEKKTLVEKHNVYRSRADPQAADMKALRWDQTLEDLATSYAAKCIWDHNEERGFRGENLFLMTGSSLDVELGMADWHRERDYYNFTTATCQENQMCGHYTQMVWAHTERVGCGEKFCEKVEGFDDSNIHLLVCNYEPPGNFQGEKPYTPGEPCSSCPSSHICEESLCVDKSLDEEETSTAQPVPMSDITLSNLDPETTPLQMDPEPTLSQLVPEQTPSELYMGPTQSELVQEATQREQVTEPTLSQLVPEQTPSQLYMRPTQSELVQEATQREQVTEPTKSEQDPDSAKSEIVPESTLSVIVTEATTSKLDSITTRISTVALDISPPQKREDSSPVGVEQTSVQPNSQVIAHPSQEYISVSSVSPLLHLDSTPHIDKTASNKAFSNDEPDVPKEKLEITPTTGSVIPIKPAIAPGTSVLVGKDNKPSENEVSTKNSQDETRKKGIQQPSKTSQGKKKLKNTNLTSFKQKNQLSSSNRRDYKSGHPEWTYFGRPVQAPHFVRAPRLCPYPCRASQSKSPLVFPLHRTNHILPVGGYNKQSQILGNPPVKPSFKQLYRLLGYKRGVYSLYLPPAKQQ